MKTCCFCKIEKPLSEYYTRATGLPTTFCRTCGAAKQREWTKEHPGHQKARRLAKYGLTLVGFLALSYYQGEACAICKGGQTAQTKHRCFDVDHCHRTGKVRALLCTNCNSLIARARESTKILDQATRYIVHYRTVV